jgi:hypothetical protein
LASPGAAIQSIIAHADELPSELPREQQIDTTKTALIRMAIVAAARMRFICLSPP